jgi:hypothetical protein
MVGKEVIKMNLLVTIDIDDSNLAQVYDLINTQLKAHNLTLPDTYDKYVDQIAKTWPCSRTRAEAIARYEIRCAIPALVGTLLEPYRKYMDIEVGFTEEEWRKRNRELDRIFIEGR